MSNPLPFEPSSKKNSKKTQKNTQTPIRKERSLDNHGPNYIPEVVSNRMIKRSVIFSGVPMLLGMLVFIGSYFIVANHLIKLPNVVVLLVSMGCLGLSVVGLSYGILSASWEEDTDGSLFGLEEFKTNFGRMVTAYQESKRLGKNN
jgi:hypothetical protein